MQGTAQLYNLARGSLDRQLQRFEEFALETCLRVPAGLMASVQVMEKTRLRVHTSGRCFSLCSSD